MTKKELIEHWISSSDGDFETAKFLFNGKKYHWSLFVGHLAIEKLLKALFIKVNGTDKPVPRIHDLVILAQKSQVHITKEQELCLREFNSFYLNGRYEDYKTKFYKKATRSYATGQIKKIKEYRLWIKSLLNL